VFCSQFGQKQPIELTSTCSEYNDSFKLIASIEDSAVIKKILAHLDEKAVLAAPGMLPEYRPPRGLGCSKGSKPAHVMP
jgi:hypothetical protein